MKELQHASLLPTDYTKDAFPEKAAKFVLKKATRLIPASVLIFAGCSGGSGAEKNNTKELESNESGYALPFPKGETWFLTGGPHVDGFSNGVRYAIDIAPPEGGDCNPFGVRRSIDTRVVTASASGEVIAKGDDKNRNDMHHSEIRIKDKNGLTQVYIHLDKTKVKVGDKVKQGAPLGNPSCEYPPGGKNTGPHVHVGLMKDGQAIPIDGAVVGGWTIHEGADGKEGTMTKDGEKTRTADTGRFGENSTGIRNDLPNNSNKAIIAGPKDPILPISGKVTEKKLEAGWTRFRSSTLPYQIDYPSDWRTQYLGDRNNPNREENLFLRWDGNLTYTVVGIVRKPIPNAVTPNDYKDQVVNQIRKLHADHGLDLHLEEPELATVAGQKAWKLVFMSGDHHYVNYSFIHEGQAWEIYLRVNDSIFEQELLQKMLASFKLLQSTEAKTPAVEGKISISKKPDELFKALLTKPMSPNVLPQGMSSGGISAGEIDATGKALKQVGSVNILIKDPDFTVAKAFPNGAISYAIFPDSSTAKSASELIGTHFGDGQVLKEFPYPTKIYNDAIGFMGTTTVLIASVENVTVTTFLTSFSFTGTDSDLIQSRTISLAQAAIEHLGKVGR